MDRQREGRVLPTVPVGTWVLHVRIRRSTKDDRDPTDSRRSTKKWTSAFAAMAVHICHRVTSSCHVALHAVVKLLISCVAVSALCTVDEDCSLNGICTAAGMCNCDKPWTNAWCGPFHASFWHAAERAVEQVNATRPPASHAAFYSRNLDRLSSYVRAGRMLEEQRPCKRGAKPVGEFVKLRSLERRGTITSKKIEYLRTRAARAGRR